MNSFNNIFLQKIKNNMDVNNYEIIKNIIKDYRKKNKLL